MIGMSFVLYSSKDTQFLILKSVMTINLLLSEVVYMMLTPPVMMTVMAIMDLRLSQQANMMMVIRPDDLLHLLSRDPRGVPSLSMPLLKQRI
jgi:hypothetical protein